MVSETALLKFKELYLKKFGKSLSDEQAVKSAVNLLNIMTILIRPNQVT